MLTTTSGISYFTGDTVQLYVNDTSRVLEKTTPPSAPSEKNSEDTVSISRKARQIQQAYQEKKVRIEQNYDTEAQQLEREYQQQKNKLEQEFRQKKQSLDINVYV